MLLLHGVIPSMSRPGFMKTLKQEEIRCREYRNIEDLRSNIDEFIDRSYNARRLHSALGYLSPDEFEKRAAESTTTETRPAPRLSFSRHREI
jgi:transposase InsO family protein